MIREKRGGLEEVVMHSLSLDRRIAFGMFLGRTRRDRCRTVGRERLDMVIYVDRRQWRVTYPSSSATYEGLFVSTLKRIGVRESGGC